MAENSEEIEQLPDNVEEAPKKPRGRPKGSRDAAPRKPRTRIVEEPPSPPPAAGRQQPARVAKPAPEPMSPRSVFRHASDAITSMQSEREAARRAYWSDAIGRTLR